METAAWFQAVLDKSRPKDTAKNFDAAVKKEAKKLTAAQAGARRDLVKASRSSTARPFFSLSSETDSAQDLARAILLTMTIGSLHNDAKQAKEKITEELIRGEAGWSDLDAIANNVIDFILGCGCDDLKDYSDRPFGFLENGLFVKNFSTWTLKLRHPMAGPGASHALPVFPGTQESRESPPVGVATSSYGYYSKHCVRDNKGGSVNHFLNLKIEIDGQDYPLQALLSLQVFPHWSREALAVYPSLQAFASVLTNRLDVSPGFDSLDQVGGDGQVRLLVDEIPETDEADAEELELTPVSSVQLIEDFMGKTVGFGPDYSLPRRFRTLWRTMTVGDGNPVTVGIFASNKDGQIPHIGQSDNASIPSNLNQKINQLYHDRVLSQPEVLRQPKKHPQEPDYKFKQRRLKGFGFAVGRYFSFCRHLRKEIDEKMQKEGIENVQGFLDLFDREPKKKRMLEILLNEPWGERFAAMIASAIIRNLSTIEDLSRDEAEDNFQTVLSLVLEKTFRRSA